MYVSAVSALIVNVSLSGPPRRLAPSNLTLWTLDKHGLAPKQTMYITYQLLNKFKHRYDPAFNHNVVPCRFHPIDEFTVDLSLYGSNKVITSWSEWPDVTLLSQVQY